MIISEEMCKEIEERLRSVPILWDGKNSILEMKNAGYKHWRQMEWMEFYFQYLCEKYLQGLFRFQFPKYGNVSFDGLYKTPFDFKAHATNTNSHKVPVNDREAMECGIKEYGSVGLIIAIGDVVYDDENRIFQKWHDIIKGNPSNYVLQNKERGAKSRIRKFSFTLKRISIIEINNKTLERCNSFQKGFRNSDGSPRREKVCIDLENLDEELIHRIEYN